MKIQVVSGSGIGRTTLSAFDAALNDSGVANYNLIQLSSIIPPASKIVLKKQFVPTVDDFGKRLYVVKAEKRSQEVGKFIAAGIGWFQLEDGRGLFVEHEEIAETRVAVESELDTRIMYTLQDMCKTRGIPFKKDTMKKCMVVREIKNEPTCVIVLAVFETEEWSS